MRLFAVLCFASFPLFAGDGSKPVFTGTWQLDPASSQIHSHPSGAVVWTIDQKDGDGIHFIESGSERGGTIDVTCGTHGADCKVQEAGKPVTFTFWYNGPALVEMETADKGAEVTKKKMQLSEDGTTIVVEVTHILPEGRGPEKLVLKKQH